MNLFSISKIARNLAIFSITLLALGSCKKEVTSVGSGFHDGDKFGSGIYRDAKMIAYTTQKDSIVTSGKSLSLIGAYKDPIFGSIKSKFGIQIALSEEDPDFGTTPEVDSVILTMPYLGRADSDSTVTFNTDSIYGNRLVPMNLKIYQLDGFLDPEETFYSDTKLPPIAGDNNVYEGIFKFSPDSIVLVHHDTTSVGKDTTIYNKIPPALRLKLKKDFFQSEILDLGGTGNLATNDNFIKNHINGLVFETTNTDGAIYSFNMFKETSLTIYYHNSDSPILDGDTKPFKSEKYNLNFSTKLTRVNSYLFDQSTADASLTAQLSPGHDTTNGSDFVFIQGMSGIQADVKLFTDSIQLDTLRKEGWLINRAELVYKVSDDNNKGIAAAAPPFRLMMANRDSLNVPGSDYRMIDYVLEPVAFDGNLNSDRTIFGGAEKRYYKFRITNFVSAILDGEIQYDENGDIILDDKGKPVVKYDNTTNYVIKLTSFLGSESVSRVKLNGSDNPTDHLFLEIHYSKKD